MWEADGWGHQRLTSNQGPGSQHPSLPPLSPGPGIKPLLRKELAEMNLPGPGLRQEDQEPSARQT